MKGNQFMKCYLVRHGESKANTENLFCGHTDALLTPKGMAQAVEASEKLLAIEFDAIYSSDLTRAKKTAELIAMERIHVKTDSNLREMHFGIFEGLTYQRIKEEHPMAYQHWAQDFAKHAPPCGESMQDVYDRVVTTFDAIIAEAKESGKENILIVSHSGVIRSLLSYLFFNEMSGYWRFKIENCGVTVIEWEDDYWTLNQMNG